jgi:hypothetical protein
LAHGWLVATVKYERERKRMEEVGMFEVNAMDDLVI